MAPSPRILHICHRYLPHLGGIEWYVHRLARDTARKGSAVAIATSTRSGVSGIKREGKIKVFYLRDLVVLPRNAFLLSLQGVVQQFRPTHVHIHSIWFLPSLQACWFKKKFGYKVINTVHGVWPDEAGVAVGLFLLLFKPIAQFILNQSDAIVVLSESEKTKLARHFKIAESKVMVIGNGIDYVAPKLEKIKLPKSYILFTGRVIPDKNPHILIEAYKTIARQHPHVELVFLGPVTPAYQGQLLHLAGEYAVRLRFYPPLDPRRQAATLAAFYHQAIVSVAIGSWEGIPTRVLESLIQGTPVIGYASGGLRDIIKEGENGYLINHLTPPDLTRALNQVLAASASQQAALRKTSQRLVTPYQWDKQFLRLHDLYS